MESLSALETVLQSAMRQAFSDRVNGKGQTPFPPHVSLSRLRGGSALTLAVLLVLIASGCGTTSRSKANPSSLGLSPEGSDRAAALAHFSQALIDENEGNVDGAITNYQQAAMFDPQHEEVSLRLAVALLQQKRQEEGVKVIQDFVSRNPRSKKALLLLALIYQSAEDLPRAQEMYERIIRIAPDSSEASLELAALLLKQKKDQQAIDVLQKAAQRADKPSDILRLLGSIYLRQTASESPKQSRKNRLAATRAFEQILQDEPDDVMTLFQLGTLYAQEQEFAKALECFAQLEGEAPQNLELRQRLALSFLKAGEPREVLESLNRIALASDHPAQIDYYMGEIEASEGNTEAALRYFRRAADEEPASPSVFLKLAVLLIDNDPEAAIQALVDGSERMPDNPAIAEMLAYIFFSREDFEQALAYFEKAKISAEAEVGEEGVNPTFYFNYSIASQRSGLIPQAAQLLALAIASQPAYLDAYLQYAFRQTDTYMHPQAIEVLEEVGRLQSDQARVYVYIGLLNSYLSRYPDAVAAFEKVEMLVDDDPNQADVMDSSYYFWYGAAREREGQFEEAERLFLQCLELDPINAEAYNYLAYMWAEKGIKLDDALEFVSKALELAPQSGAYIDTLGWVYYMQGEYEKALVEITRAAELIPNDATILEHLGDVLFKLGDIEQALPHWQQSFILEPDNEKLEKKLREQQINIEALSRTAEELQAAEELRTETPTPSSHRTTNSMLGTFSPAFSPLPGQPDALTPEGAIPTP